MNQVQFSVQKSIQPSGLYAFPWKGLHWFYLLLYLGPLHQAVAGVKPDPVPNVTVSLKRFFLLLASLGQLLNIFD